MSNKNFEKILIIDDEIEIVNLIIMLFELDFEFKFEIAHSAQDGIDKLKQIEDIDLIICDYSMPGGKGSLVYDFNKENKNLPFFLFTGNDGTELDFFLDSHKSLNNKNELIEKPDAAAIIDKVDELIKNEGNSEVKIDSSEQTKEYTKVRLTLLKPFLDYSMNLYIKINDEKMVPISKVENEDYAQVINHYQEKDVEFVWIKKEDFNKFINHFLKEVAKENISKMDKKVAFQAVGLSFQISQQHLDVLHINETHMEMVKSSIEAILNKFKENESIFDTMKNFSERKDYLTDHSTLNIYFSTLIARKMGWYTEQMGQQLSLACFFHDIYLSTNEQAMAEHFEELASKEDRQIVFDHVEKALQHIDKVSGMNEDARKIIAQHHELPNGKGFPKKLDANQIPPLSSIFILSHKIVDYLFKNNFEPSALTDLFNEIEEDYSKGNFKRPFESARQILQE